MSRNHQVMEISAKFRYFMEKYFETKKRKWVQLLFYEFYNNVSSSTEAVEALKENQKFLGLATQLSYHLLRLLFTIIDDSISNDMNVIILRKFLTLDIGARIVQFISDLDLTYVASERELVKVLFRAFPTEKWDEDLSVSRLEKQSRIDVTSIYKIIQRPLKRRPPGLRWYEKPLRPPQIINGPLFENESIDDDECLQYESDESRKFNAEFKLSSAQLAMKIIKILCKLVKAEKECISTFGDVSSTSTQSLKFVLDTLVQLTEEPLIFNENDQTVIKKELMLLMFLCLDNILKCDIKPMELVFEKVKRIIQGNSDIELNCGLLICLLDVYGILCEEETTKKYKVTNVFKDNSEMVLKLMEYISSDNELLHCIQKHLMSNIKLIKRKQQKENSKRNRKAAKRMKRIDNHHHMVVSHCIFEELLIKSIVYVRKFKQLLHILKYLRINGFCCCNMTIEIIKIFLRSSTIPSVFLKLIEKVIIRVMFDMINMCIYCTNIKESNEYKIEYFKTLNEEIAKRNGHELHHLFHHLIIIHRILPDDYLECLISTVIVPTFANEKAKFERDVDNNQDSKALCCYCLQIMSESSKNNIVIKCLLKTEIINNLRDCTLVPAMSINACIILREGLEYLLDKPDENLQKIKTIFFSNIHYLISELLDIYDQIGLAKIVFHSTQDSANELMPRSTEGCDFEILDEHIVMIKENLSNLDVLFLSSVHWNVLCDLIVKHQPFKSDFVANICNNFNEDILFSIGYHAIHTILLKRNISSKNIVPVSTGHESHENNQQMTVIYPRCDYLTPIIIKNEYDINYDFIISRSYKLFEICQNFIDKLKLRCDDDDEVDSYCMIYNISRDKDVKFKIPSIHRDEFLSEISISDSATQYRVHKDDKDDSLYTYQHWFQQFKDMSIGVFESKNLRDTVSKIINHFIHPEDELREIYRQHTIKEVTNHIGIKYLSSIVMSCFEIFFRLAENQKLCTRMSIAIDELRLLLLQDEWSGNKEALFDALQLLISVAEMKVRSVNQLLLAKTEPNPAIDAIFHDDLNISKEKIVFSDSEDGASDDDKKTETYYTADENYDADEEYFSALTADEFESSQLSHQTFSFNTISNFQNTNEHICKLVIEILMNLSTRYIENRNQWNPELLAALMKRLSCMNTHFGGSEFLVKGFSPVLSVKGSEYEALQKAILDLITDLNSPEVLKACFSILTTNNVPVELIVGRMEALCNQESIPKPFSAVQYPICYDTADPIITSTCDTDIHRPLQSFREIHMSNKLLTPFTEASQIIPLNVLELKLWNTQGYTLSTWVELKQCANDQLPSIHLLSLGTDKLILAVYVNCDGSFDFNVMKPNQNYGHNHHKKLRQNKILTSDNSSNATDPQQHNKENNLNKTNIFGIASAILKDRDAPNIRTRASVSKNGFKKRSMSKEEDFHKRMETSKVNVKSKKSKIAYDRWTHVCLSIRSIDSQITILLTLNGIEHESIEIPIDGMLESDVNGKLQMLFIGSQMSTDDDFMAHTLQYSMNNVIMFKIPLETYMIAYLHGLGPDCDNFIDCELMQCMPLRGLLDQTKLLNRTSLSGGTHDLLYKLQSNILLSFTIGKSSYATVYVKSDYGRQTGIFTIGKIPKAAAVNSLARSVYFSGGLSSMLFLFARTVELTKDPETQASALYIFLKVAYSNNYLYAEFEQKKLFNLVAHVFKHGNCYRGPGMLKAILDVIYGGTMFLKKSKEDNYEINERSELNIRNASLLVKLLSHFNIFQTFDDVEAVNLDLFFKSIITTVQDTHPYKAINRQCLKDYGFYEKLIKFCKIHLANTSSSMKITSSTALVIVDLLKMLSKNPLSTWSMVEIHKLLMLLHHPSESFVTHDRSKFNFILSSQKPSSKQYRNNPIATSRLFSSFSTKIRSASHAANSSPPSSPSFTYSSDPQKSPRFFGLTDDYSELPSNILSKSTTTIPSCSNKKYKTIKLDEMDVSQAEKITEVIKRERRRSKSGTPKKRIHKKRLQSTPIKKNPLKLQTPPSFNSSRRIADEEMIDMQLVKTFENLMSSASSRIDLNMTEMNDSRYEAGISVLQEQLFTMLKDTVVQLDDTRAQVELPECCKIESLIMFANHQDPNVRAAIIRLIHVITRRQSTVNYQKLNYWIHLGNQLSISPVNENMVQACIDWICSDDESSLKLTEIPDVRRIEIMMVPELQQMEVFYRTDLDVDVKYRPAFRVLISMLPSMTYDVQLLKYTINFLRTVIECDIFQNLMENGLVVALIKSLVKIQDKAHAECIYGILEQIAVKAFNTMGVIQILWDLLYGLTYAERQNSVIIKDIHVRILTQLLSSCLVEQQSRKGNCVKFSITKKLGNLAASEIKTRFNLVHDRSIQYILSWDELEVLENYEIDFAKYLIDLHFCGISQQGSSLILWSLTPKCCEEIKQFTAHKLISNLIMEPSFTISDSGKIFKSLLSQLIATSSTSFSDEQLKILTKFCGTSMTMSQQQQNWNWTRSAEDKVKTIRQNAMQEQQQQVDKIIHKGESVVQSCIDYAMRMTRDVIDIQNKERRQLMNELKRCQEIDFYHEWYELIQRMTHECAPWYNEDLYPTTFELDETEGPARMRIRLKRTILKIEDRFFNDECKFKAEYQRKKQLLDYLLHPKETERYSIRDQIIFTFNAKHLTMEEEIEGEVIVTDTQLIFLTNHNTYNNSIISNIADIDEIWERRYQHKEVALEIFLKSNKSFFIIFESNYDRDIVNKFMCEKIDQKNQPRKVDVITQKWIDMKMTNFEYLMELNKVSGRSYNDLMQYPIFPWILSSFEGDSLDLTHPETFRKLFKTISTQFDDTEEHYRMNYEYLMSQMNDPQSIMKPYHYSSHYSNSGTVLHFLVRLPPFTNMFLLYQDHNFDIPDRTFHSLATTFRLTSRESTTDVKELVPEFYFLPDFLVNQEGFNYGKRQSGEQVNDVKLPDWCDYSARLFMLIHRQALETDFVRKNLHQWIDLIFGYKQKGKAAVDAVNVFHPATYPEFQISSITDIVERSAYETMVRTYGQMPKQIFTSPHKRSSASNEKILEARPVLKNIKGLKWGIYTGSPQLPKPKKFILKTPISCKQKHSKLVLVKDMNMFFVIPSSSSIIQGALPNSFDLVLWKEKDTIVRTKSLNEKKSKKLFSLPSCDPVTACGTHIKYSHIWFGHQSGNISVYVRVDEYGKVEKVSRTTQGSLLEDIIDIRVNASSSSSMNSTSELGINSKWMYPIVLLRHEGEVLDIKICTEFKIAVSIGIDGRAVIWDTQKIEFIRSIEASCNTLRSQLTHVDISPTLGDILTVFKPRNDIETEDDSDPESFEITEGNGDDFINVSMSITGKSQLRLHNINGKYIGHVFVNGIVTATCFSFIKEGSGVNVMAAAFKDGSIKMYSSWNLELIREIDTGCENIIKEISFSTNHYLIILTDQEIHLWGTDGLPPERPNFHDIVFVT